MPNFRLLAAALFLTSALAACASGSDPAPRHDHMRDAKQGTAYPQPAPDQPVRKPIHDHREMK